VSRADRSQALLGAALLAALAALATGPAAAAPLSRGQLVEYVEWRFASAAPPEDPAGFVRPLRALLAEPPAAMTPELRRKVAWVLLEHEWEILKGAAGTLSRQSSVFRMQRAVAALEDACGPAPSPEWIGRLSIAHGYLADPRVAAHAVTVQDPARVRNDVRRALAAELSPSNAAGANGEIQQQFRDAFGDSLRSLGQAMVVRRGAAEAMGSVYGRSAPAAPQDLGTLERRALYEPSGQVRSAVAEILRAVFPDADPKRDLPPLLADYADMRRGLGLAAGEDPTLSPERSFTLRPDGSFPGLTPGQTDRGLANNERDRSFRTLLAKLEPLVREELAGIMAIAKPTGADDLLPYPALGEESARVAGRLLDAGDAPPFWARRFETLETLYADPSLIGPRRRIDPGERPHVLTAEQREKLDHVYRLLNRILEPNALAETPDAWIARFLAASVTGSP
jgi:hypothetical protein